MVLENGIFAFQVSIKPDYTSLLEGLQILESVLQDYPCSWTVVFVGIEEAPVKAVAETWANQIFPEMEDRMPVEVDTGWSAVDPIMDDVTYRACKSISSSKTF